MTKKKPEPQSMADALDTAILERITKGVNVSDGNGGTILVDCSAKDLEVAMKRLSMLGVLDPAADGTAAGELAKRAKRIEARLHGLKLTKSDGPPPLEAQSA